MRMINCVKTASQLLLLIYCCLFCAPTSIRAQCQEVEVITVPDKESERNINPSVSCDGQTIVWRGNDGTSNLIYRADCDGHVELVSDLTVVNTRPQISSDGSTIVWAGYTVGDDFQLLNQNIYKSVNGGPQTLVSPVTTGGTSINNDTPKVCADGSIIVWSGYIGGIDHILMNDGVQTVQISTSTSSRNSTPQISDDCSVITWMGFDPLTDRYQIFMYKDGVVTNISAPNDSERSYNHVLSGDGEVIVWIGKDPTDSDQIYMYQNNQITQITASMPGRHMFPSVSQDGTAISWSNFDKNNNTIAVYVYDDSQVSLVTNYVMTDSNPLFLSTSVSESGNSIVWADPYGEVLMYNFSEDHTTTIASEVNLFEQALQISCNEQAVVWASYVDDYHTNIYRSVCSDQFCQEPMDASGEANPDDETPVDETPVEDNTPIETVEDTAIPTMGEWGLICLMLLFLIVGVVTIKSRETDLNNLSSLVRH